MSSVWLLGRSAPPSPWSHGDFVGALMPNAKSAHYITRGYSPAQHDSIRCHSLHKAQHAGTVAHVTTRRTIALCPRVPIFSQKRGRILPQVFPTLSDISNPDSYQHPKKKALEELQDRSSSEEEGGAVFEDILCADPRTAKGPMIFRKVSMAEHVHRNETRRVRSELLGRV